VDIASRRKVATRDKTESRVTRWENLIEIICKIIAPDDICISCGVYASICPVDVLTVLLLNMLLIRESMWNMYRPKIVIAAEIWSPNLGDGIIAESLKYLLRHAQPRVQVEYLDISGRNPDCRGSVEKNQTISYIQRYIQGKKYLNIARSALKRHKLKTHYLRYWSSLIAESDAVLIGGGQLLIDNNLDFPMKVSLIASLARSLGKKAYFISCGVGAEWSWMASRLFKASLQSAADVTVRDTASLKRLSQYIPEIAVSLSADPALFASSVYEREREVDDNLLGLGLMSVDSINRHSRVKLTHDELANFWIEIARNLHKEGKMFEFFTNGCPRDYRFAEYVLRSVKQLRIPCKLAPRPTRPYELARCVNKYKAIIASRLHAHILATSYLVPSVALNWDDKVQSFFSDTGRANIAFNYDIGIIDKIIEILLEIMDEPVSESILKDKQNLILKNVYNIVNSIN